MCAQKVPPETARQLAIDYTSADISDKDMAMLGFVAKVTCDPVSCDKEDIEVLKSHGFDDRAIHDITLICSYFNFVNRIADALELELEDELVKWNQETLGISG